MITTTTSQVSYSGNNSTTTAYPVSFPFLDTAHLAIKTTDSIGTIVTLINGTDYIVSKSVDAEGRVTGGSVKSVAVIPTTTTVSIKRVTPIEQPTDFVEGGNISPEVLESALDRNTMVVQEAYRDAANAGDSNVTAAGNGFVAQTATGTFAARSISPAANSGLTIANGDGIPGNPTIDLDESILSAVTAVVSTDTLRVETSSGSKKVTSENLLAGTHFTTVDIPVSAAEVGGGSSGITVSGGIIAFTSSSSGLVLVKFAVPEDYAGGDIKFKFLNFLKFGINGQTWVWQVAAYDSNGGTSTLGSQVSGSQANYTETQSSTDGRSAAINLGGSLEAGKHYSLAIVRVVADAADVTSLDANISGIRMQYPTSRELVGW